MSDFGELCPLFNTGVFNEVTFPNISMTTITACGNALLGSVTATHLNAFTFGRTVVVTGAFVRKLQNVKGTTVVRLLHHTSQLAGGTEFATYAFSITITGESALTWIPMSVAAEKTFTSDEILGFTVATGSAASGGVFDLMVRYKEK